MIGSVTILPPRYPRGSGGGNGKLDCRFVDLVPAHRGDRARPPAGTARRRHSPYPNAEATASCQGFGRAAGRACSGSEPSRSSLGCRDASACRGRRPPLPARRCGRRTSRGSDRRGQRSPRDRGVIQRRAVPLSAQSFCTSCRICAWIVTSRAVVGSSAMISSRLMFKSAMAIATRWRMPPEN